LLAVQAAPVDAGDAQLEIASQPGRAPHDSNRPGFSRWRARCGGVRGMMDAWIGRAHRDRRDGCYAWSWWWTTWPTCAAR
jgi:hypothetical protein